MLEINWFQKHIKREQENPIIAILYCSQHMQTRPDCKPRTSFTNSALDIVIPSPHEDSESQPSCSPEGQVSKGRNV